MSDLIFNLLGLTPADTLLWLAVVLGTAGMLLALWLAGKSQRSASDKPPAPAEKWWSADDEDDHPLFARS